MKINHFTSKIVSCATQGFEADRPGIREDNKPHSTHHREIVNQDKCKYTQETVILTAWKKKVINS